MDTPWGTFALVSYVPEPLGPVLDVLSRSVPGSDQTQAHITLLPPRKLQVPMDIASEQVLRILGNFSAFQVELTSVQVFPITNVLYLDVTEGNATLHDVHAELNRGSLADDEQFEFLPHLTLGGPVDNAHLPHVRQSATNAWAAVKLPKRFLLREVVALWGRPGATGCPAWQRIWTYNLHSARLQRSARASTGRIS